MLTAEFARLAAVLGVAGGLLDPRDPVAAVHAWLAASQSPWLLIFDDASGPESVRKFLPPAGNGKVLITSQNAHWPPGQGIEVRALNVYVAARFLLARTGDASPAAAANLARELGGLPLALEQAGAYITATGISITEYLSLFQTHRADMLQRGNPTDYDKTVATTWGLAFRRLKQESKTACGLLRLLASCAPEPVPVRLILQPSESPDFEPSIASYLAPLIGDTLLTGDAVAILRKYSLVRSFGGLAGRVGSDAMKERSLPLPGGCWKLHASVSTR